MISGQEYATTLVRVAIASIIVAVVWHRHRAATRAGGERVPQEPRSYWSKARVLRGGILVVAVISIAAGNLWLGAGPVGPQRTLAQVLATGGILLIFLMPVIDGFRQGFNRTGKR